MIEKRDYKGKLFSVLGDSISTLDGYSRPHDAAFYCGEYMMKARVRFPEDTWWGRVIEALGGELLTNNSISGSLVSRHPFCITPSYGASAERISALSDNGRDPDVIMIFMGTNDWGYTVRPVPRGSFEAEDLSIFSVAYESMLRQLSVRYPNSEIWCLTIPVGICESCQGYELPHTLRGRHVDEYCEVIRASAAKFGCRTIELYRTDMRHNTIDGVHPDSCGMAAIAQTVLKNVAEF